MNNFSYEEYKIILNRLKTLFPIMDFAMITMNTEKFAVIRHDVEFSVERAYQMAKIEAALGILSSYMFQIRNNAYNTFSIENMKLIKEIYEMGHKIGLHVHLGMLEKLEQINDYIKSDLTIMEAMLKIPIDRFSYHRPPKEILRLGICLENCFNTYDRKYFDFKEKQEDLSKVQIKYIADSMHKWNYGYPTIELLEKYSKVQLLIHPYSWTELGYESKENFEDLVNEKGKIFRATLQNECKHYNY